jgi:hypothetical protein
MTPATTKTLEAIAMPNPDQPSFEDIRLEVARRRLEARNATVKENIALLEQLAREIKQGGSYE